MHTPTGICYTGFADCLLAGSGWNSSLYLLLYCIAALVLYSFPLLFLYLYVSFACLALTNLTFRGPYIVIYSYNKTEEMHYFSNLLSYIC